MCVIVYLPKGRQLKQNLLKNCYENNPDGFGIMSNVNGKLEIRQSLANFDAFLQDWKNFSPEYDRAIHFRIKTHGLINLENCHPFKINDNLAMMHNGIIHTVETDRDKSDTWHFVEHDLKPLADYYPDLIVDNELMPLVEEMTNGSRLLFMDTHGRVVRTQLKSWHKIKGCFLSNSHSHQEKVNYKSWGSYRGARYYGNDWWNEEKGYDDTKPYGTVKEIEEQQSMADLAAMPYEDLVDWIEEYPFQAADLITTFLGSAIDADEVFDTTAGK